MQEREDERCCQKKTHFKLSRCLYGLQGPILSHRGTPKAFYPLRQTSSIISVYFSLRRRMLVVVSVPQNYRGMSIRLQYVLKSHLAVPLYLTCPTGTIHELSATISSSCVPWLNPCSMHPIVSQRTLFRRSDESAKQSTPLYIPFFCPFTHRMRVVSSSE